MMRTMVCPNQTIWRHSSPLGAQTLSCLGRLSHRDRHPVTSSSATSPCPSASSSSTSAKSRTTSVPMSRSAGMSRLPQSLAPRRLSDIVDTLLSKETASAYHDRSDLQELEDRHCSKSPAAMEQLAMIQSRMAKERRDALEHLEREAWATKCERIEREEARETRPRLPRTSRWSEMGSAWSTGWSGLHFG